MTRASDLAKLLGAGATINDGTTITTADNTTQLTLTSTDADATNGPNLDLIRDSASPADGDNLGRVRFYADNDANESTIFTQIYAGIEDASDGTEDGHLKINTIVAGTGRNRLSIIPSETVFNEDSVDVDFRVESNGNANMLFVDGGNDRVGIGTNSPQKLLHLKDGDIVVGNGTASNNAVIGRIGFSTDSSNSRFIGMESFRGGDAANGDLRFHTFGGDSDSGERVRIHTNGVLSASDGIALGVGTANTSSNVLDDYEEGTWTPSFVGLSNTPVNVANIGRYTKIGNLVHVQFNYQSGGTSPTFSSNTAELQVSGLPFASTGGYYTAGTGSVASQTFNFQGSNNNQGLNGDLVVSAIAGSNIVFKVVTNGSNRSNVRNSSITGGAILETSLTYRTT